MEQSIKSRKLKINKYLKRHPAAKEYEFLFACCRAAFTEAVVEYPTHIDQKVFLKLLQRHKLIAHLWPVLKNKCKNVPEDFLLTLQSLLKQHNIHILKLSGELCRISNLFEKNNIEWISLKGPALSVQIYGDITARQSGDLDILVKNDDFDRAIQVLQQAGYNPAIDYAKISGKQLNLMRKRYKDETFIHSVNKTHIELHRVLALNNDYHINHHVFETIDTICIGNQKIPVVNFLHNILFLCLHGSIHGWYRLFWLWDFAKIINRISPEQTALLMQKALELQVEKHLSLAISLSEDIFSIKVSHILKALPSSGYISRLALRYILKKDILKWWNIPLRTIYKFNIIPIDYLLPHYYYEILIFLSNIRK